MIYTIKSCQSYNPVNSDSDNCQHAKISNKRDTGRRPAPDWASSIAEDVAAITLAVTSLIFADTLLFSTQRPPATAQKLTERRCWEAFKFLERGAVVK